MGQLREAVLENRRAIPGPPCYCGPEGDFVKRLSGADLVDYVELVADPSVKAVALYHILVEQHGFDRQLEALSKHCHKMRGEAGGCKCRG